MLPCIYVIMCLDEQNSSITLLYLLDVPSLFTHVVFTSSALFECDIFLHSIIMDINDHNYYSHLFLTLLNF